MAVISHAAMVAARYQRVKAQDARSITPVATPSGIPIISPKPKMNEGAMAVSGLPESEKSVMKHSRHSKSMGLTKKPVTITGAGSTKDPVAGFIAARLIASKTSTREAVATPNPGINTARHLPAQSAWGLTGVASRHSMLPLTFSLTREGLEKDHMKAISIINGKK